MFCASCLKRKKKIDYVSSYTFPLCQKKPHRKTRNDVRFHIHMISCRCQRLTLTLLVMSCCFCDLVWLVLFGIITSHLSSFGYIQYPNETMAPLPVLNLSLLIASYLHPFVRDWSSSHMGKLLTAAHPRPSCTAAWSWCVSWDRGLDLKKQRKFSVTCVFLTQITLEWIITSHTFFFFFLKHRAAFWQGV